MGRRKQRKRNRRIERRATRDYQGAFAEPFDADPVEELLAGIARERMWPAQETATCGQCREFVHDGDAGRGTCLHPASGVLAPWTDTPACPYYARGSRLRSGE
jgi:hypothetical protein